MEKGRREREAQGGAVAAQRATLGLARTYNERLREHPITRMEARP